MDTVFEKSSIDIKGRCYNIAAVLSQKDITKLFYCSSKNAYRTIARILNEDLHRNNIVIKSPTIDESDKKVINKYIDIIIKNNDSLAKEIHKVKGKTKAEQLVNAVKIQSEETVDVSSELLLSQLVQLGDALSGLIKEEDSIINSVISALKDFCKSLKKVECIKQIYEEIDNAEIWAEYGWSIIPMYNNMLLKKPKDKKHARKLAMYYCDKENMQCIIRKTKRKSTGKKDIDEAYWLFEKGKYKSCSLLLFSLIDRKLFDIQSPDETQRKKRNNNETVKLLAAELRYHSINSVLIAVSFLKCYLKIYEQGNDFINKPEIINRNYLVHGMWMDKVYKYQCFQLFLLLYNLDVLIDNARKLCKKHNIDVVDLLDFTRGIKR